HGTNDPGLPGPTPAGVVNTTATDGTRPPTLLNDTGNVTQTLASLARNAGETVTAPGPTYAITSGVLNALGGSAAGNYSTSGALSVANSPTLTITKIGRAARMDRLYTTIVAGRVQEERSTRS